jgi:hypothetical protein
MLITISALLIFIGCNNHLTKANNSKGFYFVVIDGNGAWVSKIDHDTTWLYNLHQ